MRGTSLSPFPSTQARGAAQHAARNVQQNKTHQRAQRVGARVLAQRVAQPADDAQLAQPRERRAAAARQLEAVARGDRRVAAQPQRIALEARQARRAARVGAGGREALVVGGELDRFEVSPVPIVCL